MDVKSTPRATGEAPNFCARSIKALVAIAIEHTEDRVVAALLRRPLFGALDDTDGRAPFVLSATTTSAVVNWKCMRAASKYPCSVSPSHTISVIDRGSRWPGRRRNADLLRILEM